MTSIPCFGQVVRTESEAQAQKLVSEESIYDDICFLCDTLCGGRGTGTPGGSVTAMWIGNELHNCGIVPFDGSYFKHFKMPNGKTGRNVMGMLPHGGWYNSGNYVIVGAHYDNIGTVSGVLYPGADSNASGVVAMISLARMMSWMKDNKSAVRSNIIFVAFDAREMDRGGSNFLWETLCDGKLKDPCTGKTITRDKVRLMVNIDQIGCSMNPVEGGRQDYILMLGNESLPLYQRIYARNVNHFSDIQMFLEFNYFGSGKFTEVFYRLSDQRAFVDGGIPSILFTSGITMNNNKPKDTPDTIDLKIMKKRIWFIFHWLWRAL